MHSEKYLYQDDAILDIGCGSGRTTFTLYKKGIQNITGIDLAPSMLNEAEKIVHEYNQDIPFILGDATNLPFNDTSFDKAIFAFNGLMQIPQRQNRTLALKEINCILKPEGIFIFTTHDRDKNENHLNFREQGVKGNKIRGFMSLGIFSLPGRYLPPYPNTT
ncbi:class I SAM-dependent methyltransferase [Peribacillus simplex]|uniref:Class I SAM-dependent methyltransferase n=2 Tax=Peribacillus TaxID=2675229 RepID=A0AA90T8V7_9BACI|nr:MULTISPECIES: class I SAM-dependent methyltransferase [Peribacillus]MDP1421547.1 class I SAM-dependent methyltransferase [Peribacillus simplex]MDP1454302.1 class I SAM-dependent methyltransferase [Peribacillus frigoritolerans]